MPFLVGLLLTPIAALIGTLPFFMMSVGKGMVFPVLVIGLGLGSVFAAPVTSLAFPLTYMVCRNHQQLKGDLAALQRGRRSFERQGGFVGGRGRCGRRGGDPLC
jgi:hypothetical protein